MAKFDKKSAKRAEKLWFDGEKAGFVSKSVIYNRRTGVSHYEDANRLGYGLCKIFSHVESKYTSIETPTISYFGCVCRNCTGRLSYYTSRSSTPYLISKLKSILPGRSRHAT